jgi:hypothetical protein
MFLITLLEPFRVLQQHVKNAKYNELPCNSYQGLILERNFTFPKVKIVKYVLSKDCHYIPVLEPIKDRTFKRGRTVYSILLDNFLGVVKC